MSGDFSEETYQDRETREWINQLERELAADGSKSVDRAEVMALVKKTGEDDLIFLNRLIVERLKLLSQARSTRQMSRFNIGDRVSFRARGGRKTGVIMRLHKKTASIRTDDGEDWNVSPMFLSAIKKK